MTDLQKAVEHVAIHRYATVDNTGRILTADQEARVEIVKLKQEVAELRVTIERLDGVVSGLLKDHDGNYSPTLKPLDDGWGHAEDGWPWDVSATDSIPVTMFKCPRGQRRERIRDTTVAVWALPNAWASDAECIGKLHAGMNNEQSTGAQ